MGPSDDIQILEVCNVYPASSFQAKIWPKRLWKIKKTGVTKCEKTTFIQMWTNVFNAKLLLVNEDIVKFYISACRRRDLAPREDQALCTASHGKGSNGVLASGPARRSTYSS